MAAGWSASTGLTGDHDGLVIYEVADVATAGAFAAGVVSSGLVSGLDTHELLDSEQAAALLAGAKKIQAAYQTPGA